MAEEELTAGRWPAGYRCALAVTIDVDGRYGEANSRPADDMYWISQTAYDPRGTERLLAVLADRGVSGTFCWVGRAAEDHPLHVRAAVDAGHEIALHSWEHRPYNRMSAEEQRADMERTLEALTRLSGTAPVGHKTASWRYDEATHRVAQELELLWVMDEPGGDLPYLVRPNPGLPPLVQIPPSHWFDDYKLFVDNVMPPAHGFEMWRDDLDVLRDEGGLMGLTLHPFVSGRGRPARCRGCSTTRSISATSGSSGWTGWRGGGWRTPADRPAHRRQSQTLSLAPNTTRPPVKPAPSGTLLPRFK